MTTSLEFLNTDVDSIVSRSLATWAVPGAAVVVVQNGRVVHLAGYGEADLCTHRPTTPETIFSIASCTKAFAATACALLVQDGRLKWDDRVRSHLKHFRMGDPFADAEVTIRDLLCHRTGLGNHDLLWRLAPWDFQESLRRLSFLELDAPFRTRYDYNNFLYIAIGCVISAAAEQPWHEFVRRRLFEPLGMTRTVFTAAEAESSGDVSSPHWRRRGTVQRYPGYAEMDFRASGSMKSCARDLGTWLLFQMSGGIGPDGTRLLTTDCLEATHTPQMLHGVSDELCSHANTRFCSYGLGWHILDYKGQLLVEHSGGVGGFRAFAAFLPQRRAGLAILANLRRSDMAIAAGRQLLDALLELPSDDWDGIYLESVNRRQLLSEERIRLRDADRIADTLPSRKLSAYGGLYREDAYGELVIETSDSGNALALRWSSFHLRLEHHQDDTFTARNDDPGMENPLDGMQAVFSFEKNDRDAEVVFLRRRFLRCNHE